MNIIEKLKRRLAALEFEIRYETDPREKDYIADDRDAVERKLAAMDCDGLDPDGRPTRGFICDKCGEVIGIDPDEQCKHCDL